MTNFPNETPLSVYDAIDLANSGIFYLFEKDLRQTSLGSNQSKNDYEFRLAGQNQAQMDLIIARPIGVGNLWACDISGPSIHNWTENAQFDPSTGKILISSSNPRGISCPQCGTSGLNGNYCNNCGGSLASALVPPGTQASPANAQSAIPPANSDPNRMTGRPKKEIVVPEGMTKLSQPRGFEEALDSLLSGETLHSEMPAAVCLSCNGRNFQCAGPDGSYGPCNASSRDRCINAYKRDCPECSVSYQPASP